MYYCYNIKVFKIPIKNKRPWVKDMVFFNPQITYQYFHWSYPLIDFQLNLKKNKFLNLSTLL